MGKEAKNPKEHSTLRVRRTVTPAKLAANRANAKLGGCRDSRGHSGEQHKRGGLTAIRDLFDRGHGRPRQAIEGSGPGGAIPFSVILPAVLCDDDD